MPRLNYGTLLENIVVVEATRLCSEQSNPCETLAFASSFSMPPLTECWSKRFEEQSSRRFSYSFLASLGRVGHLPDTLQGMWSLCLANKPKLPK